MRPRVLTPLASEPRLAVRAAEAWLAGDRPNKALELLGKTDEIRLFVDRTENTNVNVDLGELLRARRARSSRAKG